MHKFSPKFFEKNWPLSDVHIGDVLQQSDGRLVCKLQADEGNFVFKAAAPSKNEGDIESDTFVLDFLEKADFQHAPQLFKTNQGKRYKKLQDQFVYIMEYIDGKQSESTPDAWKQLGAITAKIHAITDYPHETSFTVASELPRLKEEAQNFLFTSKYMDLIESLPNFSTLSTSLIHTDIGPHNAIQKSSRGIVLTDWDDAGVGTTVLDLGLPLITQFVTDDLHFQEEQARAFYGTYFSKRTLPDEERSSIFDAGLFFALIYLPYEDINKSWRKIQFAINNREDISAAFK